MEVWKNGRMAVWVEDTICLMSQCCTVPLCPQNTSHDDDDDEDIEDDIDDDDDMCENMWQAKHITCFVLGTFANNIKVWEQIFQVLSEKGYEIFYVTEIFGHQYNKRREFHVTLKKWP